MEKLAAFVKKNKVNQDNIRRHNKAMIMFDPSSVALRLAWALDTGIIATKVPM